MQAIHKHPIRLILISCFLFSQWPPNGQKVPLFGVCVGGAWMVSVGCLDGLGVIWDTSMGDKIVILNEKVQSLSYNSHTTFSPSAHFLAKIGQNDVFSDPCYGGSNVIFDQNRHIPQVLYIKLHLKMPGNDQL